MQQAFNSYLLADPVRLVTGDFRVNLEYTQELRLLECHNSSTQ